MVRQVVDVGVGEETLLPPSPEISLNPASSEAVILSQPLNRSKTAVRTSLRASTFDGVFSAIFTSTTTGILLTNFLLELGATSVEIGLLASVPMLVNLLQPLGAYLAAQTSSRYRYGLWVFGFSRLLWLVLVLGITQVSDAHTEHHHIVLWTLGIVLASHIFNALGSASWLSWIAVLVPQQLRGRYFGVRSSAANLINLVGVPLLGLGVSVWRGGAIQGYGVVLFIGVIAGLISLVFQGFMVDINPQTPLPERPGVASSASSQSGQGWLKDRNFLTFLVYCGLWTFAVNLSAPFFNIYMLDNLQLDVSVVTLYSSFTAGANLLMLVMWGKLADKIGNRPILILVGILAAIVPLLWLQAGANSMSLWVWLPLIHLFSGGAFAAVDLCNNNMQMSVAPVRSQSTYFAIAAAIMGVSGAMGTASGGFLAQFSHLGGLPGLFALSGVLRLVALLPLVFVLEQRSQPVMQLVRSLKVFQIFRKPIFLPPVKPPQPVFLQAVRLAIRLPR
jgi:MFS family permease